MLQKGANVTIAGNGGSLYLLKEQYPSLKHYELPGYNISYPIGKNAAVQSLLQAPKILSTIKKEKLQTESIINEENIDFIISDNRYGVRNDRVKSVFMCHQVALQAPKRVSFLNPLLLKLHLQQINKFDMLWIPDESSKENLSGILSHNITFDIPHRYIGLQSRFVNFRKKESFIDSLDFSIAVVLSGPEPQRTVLEDTLREQLQNVSEKILLIQGKTEQQNILEENNITAISYLNTNDLYAALTKASTIICRSGYSSIMDLAVLGKKALLIPTAGQTEQEYLASSLSEKGYALTCRQEDLDIQKALQQLERIEGFPIFEGSQESISAELEELLFE